MARQLRDLTRKLTLDAARSLYERTLAGEFKKDPRQLITSTLELRGFGVDDDELYNVVLGEGPQASDGGDRTHAPRDGEEQT